ncbi:hypothetical protein [Halarcobacter sp.]|uniref:hypothetical protein n=1 Tax=Halarcobacter sp. TaxID=2321133 RepID=UPI002AA8525C|nr:hypothetical protein [Halarcobacter sp.]
MKKFKLDMDHQKLSLIFEIQKTSYIAIVSWILIQYITIVLVFSYLDNIPINTTIIIICIATIINIFAILYFTWEILSRKKLELDKNGVIYSKTLFGKIKSYTYKWFEIKKFTNTNYKGKYILTIKKSDDKDIQLFYGINESESKDILHQLNKFRSDI